jgi:hypothetical protein
VLNTATQTSQQVSEWFRSLWAEIALLNLVKHHHDLGLRQVRSNLKVRSIRIETDMYGLGHIGLERLFKHALVAVV